MAEQKGKYLHGFDQAEQKRLYRQAEFAEYLIFQDINFSDCKHLLEVGCGVGAQTGILLRRFPKIHVTGIDLSEKQLASARKHLEQLPYAKGRYELHCMDAGNMEFDTDFFSGAFVCWTLEHIPKPLQVLTEIRRVLRPGGQVVITEVMNSSFFLDPYSPNLLKYLMAFNDYLYESGGDPFVGAKLGNFLLKAGYQDVNTNIKTWHLDSRSPGKRKEGIKERRELLLSAQQRLINAGGIDKDVVENMKKELEQVLNNPDAVLFDAFFQAKAVIY
ncbi:MAG: methyltransferase domain-containing protein [Halobacteriovoraceae bacterium]|nr:methyltransferase domain-containing protein [Halobacteriovoraceae bacterium]